VDCDTSKSGFGAILHQGGWPITFFGHAIAPHHTKLTTYEPELIGLVKVVLHWRPYLWMRPFIVRTDHYNLKYLLDQQLLMIPQYWLVSKLFDYQFTVKSKLGHQNIIADALSRHDEDSLAVHALSLPEFDLFDQFF
jgi:hypothetical protein